MPDFPKPSFSYNYVAASQLNALRTYRDTEPGRAIPTSTATNLRVATWNIANFGTQERRDRDFEVIAELISWFDVIALQEVKDDPTHLRAVSALLPGYDLLHSDKAGNDERMAFMWNRNKVQLLEKVGEVAVKPSAKRYITLPGTTQTFDGFDRNPYLAAFQAGTTTFLLVCVHLYFGSDSTRDKNRRSLEAYAIGRWADLRRQSANAFTPNIIVLGDFNIPMATAGDPIYDALVRRGLQVPQHSTSIASSISTDNHYDQIAFVPGPVQNLLTGQHGVFDFDNALFSSLWNDPNRSDAEFRAYMRYYISDHRIMWTEFSV